MKPKISFGGLPPQISIVIIIIILVVVFGLLFKWGLFTRKEKRIERDIDEIVKKKNFFNPNLWKTASSSILLPVQSAKNIASIIEDSWGWFNDDEDKIYGAFRSLKNKIQVSQVSFYYLSMFGEDLESRLIEGLSKAELKTIFDIIDRLPNV